jgi:hypothetical protein
MLITNVLQQVSHKCPLHLSLITHHPRQSRQTFWRYQRLTFKGADDSLEGDRVVMRQAKHIESLGSIMKKDKEVQNKN